MTRSNILRGIFASLTLCLTGCMQSADLSAVDKELLRPFHRADQFQAAASNGTVVVAGTDSGVVIASADQGKTWERQALGQLVSIQSISACPNQWFAALDFYHKVWVADPKGKTWASRDLQKSFSPTAITCDANNRLWVVGSYSTIASSIDNGRTWTEQTLNADSILTTVQFVDTAHGFVTGEFGTVAKTTDAGVTWDKQPALPDQMYPFAAHFFDSSVGIVNNSAGESFQTRDAGRNWERIGNPAKTVFYSLLYNGATLYGVGASGQVARLSGLGWVLEPDSGDRQVDLLGVAPLDGDRLLAVGPAGTVVAVPAGSAQANHS